MKRINKNAVIFTAVFLVLAITMCSCGAKTAIDYQTFTSKSEDLELRVSDDTRDADDDSIERITFATSGNWHAVLYEFDSDSNAAKYFNKLKDQYASYSGSSNYSSGANYQTFEYNSNNETDYYSQISNTLVTSIYKDKYKEEAKELFNSIGY